MLGDLFIILVLINNKRNGLMEKQIDGIPVYKQPPQLKNYTYVAYSHGKLFVRGIDFNGRRTMFYSDYQPTVWVPLDFNYNDYKQDIIDVQFNQWKDLIDNKLLVGLKFKSIYACNQFIHQNTKISKNQFGTIVRESRVHTSPSNHIVSQYIAENFKEEQHVSAEQLRILSYDIETEVGHRNVPDDTYVQIRNKNTNVIKQVTIGDYEDLYNDSTWLIWNESINEWVNYNDHPYRFVGNFPDPLKADEKVILITVKDINNNVINTWGLSDFENTREDVVYHKCDGEKQLLQQFVEFIHMDYPDVITGWNISVFDSTYIANRVKNVLGEEVMKLLSPLREINFKQVDHNEFGKSIVETSWAGISDLDYLRLYKKYTYGNRESYKLDAIAETEIKVKKVPNPIDGSFKEFYSGKFDIRIKPSQDDNDIKKLGWARTQLRKKASVDELLIDKFKAIDSKVVQMCKQLFVKYNIRDVELVDKIDKKQKFINLAMTIAYLSHCNYEDVFSPVKTWDYTIYNTLLKDNLIIPIKKGGEKSEKFPGAYVKEPLVGKHEYCESFDLDSLYPHILMEYNISPETLLKDKSGNSIVYPVDLEALIAKTQDMSFAKQNNYSVAATGVCFSKEKQGVIPKLCEDFYANRKATKKKFLLYKNEHEKIVEELRKRGIEV